jgi:hypothetical protein
LAAAKVGGIHANNTYPADFIYQNLMIQNNVIHQSYAAGIKKLLFFEHRFFQDYPECFWNFVKHIKLSSSL